VFIRTPLLYALWKPAGWTVSVSHDATEDDYSEGGTETTGPALQDWLGHELGEQCPIAYDYQSAHGLIHRLDQYTSGAILWATGYEGYCAGRLHLAARRVQKEYVCLCHGWFPQGPKLIQKPLLKVTSPQCAPRSVISPAGQRACTEIKRVGHLLGPGRQRVSLIWVQLHTGHLHQIRVHLSNEGHPLVGDEVYGHRSPDWCPRTFLHACRLKVEIGDSLLDAKMPPPAELQAVLDELAPMCSESRSALLFWQSKAQRF